MHISWTNTEKQPNALQFMYIILNKIRNNRRLSSSWTYLEQSRLAPFCGRKISPPTWKSQLQTEMTTTMLSERMTAIWPGYLSCTYLWGQKAAAQIQLGHSWSQNGWYCYQFPSNCQYSGPVKTKELSSRRARRKTILCTCYIIIVNSILFRPKWAETFQN